MISFLNIVCEYKVEKDHSYSCFCYRFYGV